MEEDRPDEKEGWTLRWWWVSRRAYDDMRRKNLALETEIAVSHVPLATYDLAVEIITDLRESNRIWADHARRLERKGLGMTEAPREPKVSDNDPMPPELWEYIGSFGDRRTVKTNKAVAYRRKADGETWDEIIADVIVPPEPRERIMGAEDPEEEAGEGDEDSDTGSPQTEAAEAGSRSG